MTENVCAVCLRRISAHTIKEAAECTRKFGMVEVERTANKLCISCGSESDLLDPNGTYWCNSCLAWQAQRNDETNMGEGEQHE